MDFVNFSQRGLAPALTSIGLITALFSFTGCGKAVSDFGFANPALAPQQASLPGSSNSTSTNGIRCEVFDLSHYLIKHGCIEQIPCSATYPGPNCYREVPGLTHSEWTSCRTLPNLHDRELPSSAKGDYPHSLGFIEFKQFDVSARSYEMGFPYFPEDLRKTMKEFYALSCTGQIQVPVTDHYKFMTVTDDGIRFLIDNQKVIVNEVAHPPTKDAGSMKLEKGLHPFKLEWSQYIKTEIALEIYWNVKPSVISSSSGTKDFEIIPANAWFRD